MSYKFGPAGGVGGTPFDAPYPTGATTMSPYAISAMKGRSGSRIDQIQVVWAGAGGGGESPPFGGEGGSPFRFDLPPGESLAQIVGSVGYYENSVRVFSIQFITNAGTRSNVYGQATSAAFSFQCPTNYVVTGIFGRADRAVDALGVYIAST
jgi:Jacalin-like lectin domain